MQLYPKKTFIFITLWVPWNTVYILKDLRIDAGSELKSFIKLIKYINLLLFPRQAHTIYT